MLGARHIAILFAACAIGTSVAAQDPDFDPEPPNAELIPDRFQGFWATNQADCKSLDKQTIVGPQFVTFRVDHDGFETQTAALSARNDREIVLRGRTVDFSGRSLRLPDDVVLTLTLSRTKPETLTTDYKGGARSTMALCRRG